MSFKFEMANVTESLTNLYRYVAEMTAENAWKNEPVITESATETRIKFPHPNAVAKDLKANNEPFSAIEMNLAKPDAAEIGFEFIYNNKKAAARFGDILQKWNKNLSDTFFNKVQQLDGFTFRLQLKTTFKNSTTVKYDEVYSVPAASVNVEDVEQQLKKIIDQCAAAELVEDGKTVKLKVPSVSIRRAFSTADLASDDSPFDTAIKSLYGIMLSEVTILSEKDVEKAKKERKKVEGKNKFQTIISNRADRQFYCRLSKSEFERIPDNIGVQIWDTETFADKKFIRGALKLVREI